MKIVIEVSNGMVQQVNTTDKAKICIVDHDAIDNADSLKEISNNFNFYKNKVIKYKKEIKSFLEDEEFKAKDDEDEEFKAKDDFINLDLNSSQKKLKSLGYIDECNKCEEVFESFYLYAKCPNCGEININCNLCSMDNCAKCNNGSQFDGE